MKTILITTLFLFPFSHLLNANDRPSPTRVVEDVMVWATNGSAKFDSPYLDAKSLRKKMKILVTGAEFANYIKNRKLPEAFFYVEKPDLKQIDWSTHGFMSVAERKPDGSFTVNISIGDQGRSVFRIVPNETHYNVEFVGQS